MKKTVQWILAVAVVLAVVIQFIRPEMGNPPIDAALTLENVAHISPATLAQLRTSCFDCHSNETRWPWYSGVAPMSWLLARDVREGRKRLNFSAWGKYATSRRVSLLGRIAEEVSSGDMPLPPYLLLHAEARLSGAAKDSLVSWAENEQDRLFTGQAVGGGE